MEEVNKIKKHLREKGITDITVVKVVNKVKRTVNNSNIEDSIINFGEIGNINSN
jgi:hypothetical protein